MKKERWGIVSRADHQAFSQPYRFLTMRLTALQYRGLHCCYFGERVITLTVFILLTQRQSLSSHKYMKAMPNTEDQSQEGGWLISNRGAFRSADCRLHSVSRAGHYHFVD